MNTDELMIGDWVLYNDKTIQVEEIVTGGINPEWLCGMMEYIIQEEDLKPIPLTNEILEKNGMHLFNRKTRNLMEDCNHSDCFKEDEDNILELSLNNNGTIRWSINGDEYTIIPLDYVHQLQHALRLCGINKEIIL